jgi:hypothetical protein
MRLYDGSGRTASQKSNDNFLKFAKASLRTGLKLPARNAPAVVRTDQKKPSFFGL